MPITWEKGVKINVTTFQNGRKRPRSQTVDATPVLSKTNDVQTTSSGVIELEQCPSVNPDHELQNMQQTCYRQMKCEVIDAWRSIEQELLTTRMDLDVLSDTKCGVCGIESVQLIRCQDCGPYVFYCKLCEPKAHLNVFHKSTIWEDDIFVPYVGESKVLRRPGHKCNTETSRLLIIVDSHGRLHNALAVFCNCESHPSTLLRYGFWAATPTNPSVGFSVDLLNTLHLLTLECAVSVKGFVQMLRWKNDWSEMQFNRLYHMLIGESISSYRTFVRHFEQHHLRHTPIASKSVMCPACPKDGGVTTVSIDGNFGLVRKRHSGFSPREPSSVESSFFMKDDEVEAFVNSYQNDKQTDQECSTFKAGDAVRSGARNAKLDVRGVFGSVCRHEFPVLFMDMKHAERLAYPICLIEQMRKTLGNTQLQVVYDIACVLTRHLQRTEQTSILDGIRLGLPIFHAYGHGASCQIQYSIRNMVGFGLTDGEGTERLWSFLRPLSTITKEMTPTHRKELLNDALNHFCRRKIAGLETGGTDRLWCRDVLFSFVYLVCTDCLAAKWLDMRVIRAADVQKEATKNLKDLTDLLEVTNDQVRAWALDQKQQFIVAAKPLSKSSTTWETSYVTKLQSYISLSGQLQSCMPNEIGTDLRQKIIDLEASLSKIERNHSITRWTTNDSLYVDTVDKIACASKTKVIQQLYQDSSSRAFLVQLLSKYCDGQMIAIRLSKQVQKATTAVKKGVQLYNGISGMKGGSRLPQTITEKDALIPSSSVFSSVLEYQQNERFSVPAVQRWKAVEYLMLCHRAAEEVERITDDVRLTLQHFKNLHCTLSRAMLSVSTLAERTRLKREILSIEVIMKGIWSVACKHLVGVERMPSLNDMSEQTLFETPMEDTVARLLDASVDCDVDSDNEYDSEEDC